ncbi:MAG: tetratricopeptide repeat protein, partial [Blastocatellia bacterium]|nr:tetratricopeptide repeat protein [Blastocatellia bacterium]
PEVADRELQAVIAIDPGNAEAHVNLGVLAFFHGDCQSASPHFENALKTQPSLVKAEALLGICDKRMGRSSAKARLESSFSALTEPRLITQVGLELVDLYYREGDLEHASSAIQKLVNLNPEQVDILYLAQRIYTELADNTLNKLAIIAPNSARMQQVIAQRLINAGDLQGAISHYRKALEIDHRLPGVHYELAQALLESSSSDAQAQAEAEREIEEAVKIDGTGPRIECLRGQIARQHADYSQALAHYGNALALSPSDPEAQLGLARVLMATEKLPEARGYLQSVIQADPLNGEAHYRLALVGRKLGLTEESEKEMRLFQEIRQTKDQVKELYKQMNKQSNPGHEQLDDLPQITGKGRPF